MDYFSKRERIVLLIVVISIISVVVFKMGFKELEQVESQPLNFVSNINIEENPEPIQPTIIMVHISGEVYKPGIVQMDLGKRLIDAIQLAGGLKKDADLDRINLARKLDDEEKIYIPKVGEELNNDIIQVVMNNNTSSNSSNVNNSSKININKCSQIELESLPGIGPVLAGKIIEYRNATTFLTIEDLKQVSGIGDKKYEALKDLITVK